MVEQLEQRLAGLSQPVERSLGVDISSIPGGGAAGGLAAGAFAFFNGRLCPGVDAVINTVGLGEKLQGADWVLTGEGSFDSQSLQGKVVDGVLRTASARNVKTGVIAGVVGLTGPQWHSAGVEFAVALKQDEMSVEESIRRSRELLSETCASFADAL
jgi:glycerate kinase